MNTSWNGYETASAVFCGDVPTMKISGSRTSTAAAAASSGRPAFRVGRTGSGFGNTFRVHENVGISSGIDASSSRNAGKLGISSRKKLASSMFAFTSVPLSSRNVMNQPKIRIAFGHDRRPSAISPAKMMNSSGRTAQKNSRTPSMFWCRWCQSSEMYLSIGPGRPAIGTSAPIDARPPPLRPVEENAGSWPRPRSFHSARSRTPGTSDARNIAVCDQRRATSSARIAAPKNREFEGFRPITNPPSSPARIASTGSFVSIARTSMYAVRSTKTVDGKSASTVSPSDCGSVRLTNFSWYRGSNIGIAAHGISTQSAAAQ